MDGIVGGLSASSPPISRGRRSPVESGDVADAVAERLDDRLAVVAAAFREEDRAIYRVTEQGRQWLRNELPTGESENPE